MSKQSHPKIQLNDWLGQNWKSDAGPVAVLNMESTTHERVAYCWGLAETLNVIADLGIASDDRDISRFAGLISRAVAPLISVLDQLGTETLGSDGGGAV
jgi:hypothetical protein